MIRPDTICVDFVYHRLDGRDIWYNHTCEAPQEKKPVEVDCVTGRQVFASRNDLGNVYVSDSQYPYCRDINKGNCPHYEKI